MAQYVYSMIRVGKVVPPKREILKNISLSFFPGAKIGVLGLNGSGKSTLLRIMAGPRSRDRRRCGGDAGHQDRIPAAGAAARRREHRQAGGRSAGSANRCRRKQKLEEIYAAYAEPDADFDQLAAEQAKYEAILATTRPGHRASNGNRGRRAAPAAMGRGAWHAVGRRKAPRRAVQAVAVEARHAAARRADQPSGCRKRRLARTISAAFSRHGRRGHARSLLSRQRRRVDPRARSRARHSVQRQLQRVASNRKKSVSRASRSRKTRA